MAGVLAVALAVGLVIVVGPHIKTALSASHDAAGLAATCATSVGDNLFTFMANRLSMSFANLSCQGYGLDESGDGHGGR